MCRKIRWFYTKNKITCSLEAPSLTCSSPLALASVEGGGTFLPHFRPKGTTGFGALPRESLAGLTAVSLVFTSSVFSDLNIWKRQKILM